jgi:hypothetical protein
MRKNEHPGCSCSACRRGKHSGYGRFVVKQVNKKLRRLYREMLAKGDGDQLVLSTPYTD